MRKTQVLLSIAGVAVVAGAGALYLGSPQTDPGTEGTIGAATRYQAQQISKTDVILADAGVQDFLQSDTFDKLMKDENTLAMLSDSAFQSALADAEFRTALADASFPQALKAAQEKNKGAQFGGGGSVADVGYITKQIDKMTPKMRGALSGPEFAAALQNQAFQSALKQSAFAAALQSQQFTSAVGLATTVKSGKSNSSELTTVKSSKSNSQDLTTVKGSKSNSDN